MPDEKFIEGTEYFVAKGSKNQTIYDCDGDFIASVPLEWGEHELQIWANAYDAGEKKGREWGRDAGEYRAQSAMQEALGIRDRLNEMENNIKLLASVLYWHDGICKEDIAAIAGRG